MGGREALGEEPLDGGSSSNLTVDFFSFWMFFFLLAGMGLSSKDRVCGFSFGELGHVDLTGGS
jgi:hypothetical protein